MTRPSCNCWQSAPTYDAGMNRGENAYWREGPYSQLIIWKRRQSKCEVCGEKAYRKERKK